MSTLKRILVATDFTDHARNALELAAFLARQSEAEIILCHVIDPTLVIPPPKDAPERAASDARAQAETWLQQAGIENGRVLIEQGHAFAEIVRLARNEDADLVVLGSHGRGAIAHLLLGSVAERVVRKAPCSVLVVREGQHDFRLP